MCVGAMAATQNVDVRRHRDQNAGQKEASPHAANREEPAGGQSGKCVSHGSRHAANRCSLRDLVQRGGPVTVAIAFVVTRWGESLSFCKVLKNKLSGRRIN